MDAIRTEYHFAQPKLGQYGFWLDSPRRPDGAKFAVQPELQKFYVTAEITFKDRTRTPTHEVAILAWFEVDLETWLCMRDLDQNRLPRSQGYDVVDGLLVNELPGQQGSYAVEFPIDMSRDIPGAVGRVAWPDGETPEEWDVSREVFDGILEAIKASRKAG